MKRFLLGEDFAVGANKTRQYKKRTFEGALHEQPILEMEVGQWTLKCFPFQN